MNIKETSKKYEQYTIGMRREFHMNPEPSMHETRTAGRIKEELTKMGIPYISIGESGVVATIEGRNKGKVIALRADMDSLEIKEVRDVQYKSKNEGLMHACGHDAHTAMLLGAAQVLNEIKNEFDGTVKLIFQPGEEVAQGAKAMIKGGALEGVQEVFGMHVAGNLPAGKIGVGGGPRMASVDMFRIIVKGVGGHGSMPNFGVDAVVAASAIVMNLQTLVSREISPMESVVVSIGKLVSGTRFNVIADEAIMEGTTRCFSYEIRKQLPQMMERIIKSTAESYRAEARLEYNLLTAPLINNEASSERAKKSVEKILSKEAVAEFDKTTGGEDFSEYLELVPGTFAILGTANKEKGIYHNIHHPMFDVDEAALVNGVALHVQYAYEFLMNE